MEHSDDKQKSILGVYREEIARYPLLTFEQELRLAEKIEAGDKDARQSMINANLRLVLKMAAAYKVPGVNLLDLVQEGNMGLMKAVDRYDYRKNVRFCTYASWWIKQSISRYLSEKSNFIRLPYRKKEFLGRIQSFIKSYISEYQKSPSINEIAEALNSKYKEILFIMNYLDTPVSLYSSTSTENGVLMDFLEDGNYEPEGRILKEYKKQAVQDEIHKLEKREREVIRYRYHFINGKKHTLKHIAQRLGVSPETVRQIEMRALKKLKEGSEELRDYMYS